MKRTSRTNFLLLSFLTTIMIFNLVNVSQAYIADTTNDEQMVSLEMEQVIPEITKTSTSDFVSTISADADKNWTFMIYIAGDNNLEGAAIDDLQEMEQAGGSSAEINIIVFLDRHYQYDNSNGDWTEARIYDVVADTTPFIDSTLLDNLGEVNTGDAATLNNFIDFCFTNYPADHYCLDIWDHGGGVYGAAQDETSSFDMLRLNEMDTAIQQACDDYGERIDVFTMDCCVMNMAEMAFEVREYCDYFVASEENIPWDGFNYEDIFTYVLANPDLNSLQLCNTLVSSYASEYLTEDLVTISTIDLSEIDDVATAFDSFSTVVIDAIKNRNFGYPFFLARGSSTVFFDNRFVDIIHLAEQVKYFGNLQSITDVCDSLIEAVDDAVLYNWQHSSLDGNANGMSVFLPISDFNIDGSTMYAYANRTGIFTGMDWQAATLWGEFIRDYYDHYQLTAPANPEIISLGSEIQTHSLGLNNHIQYMVYLPENGIYDFSCSITSGDVNFLVIATSGDGSVNVLGKSNLINPDDGNTERVRLSLSKKYHYIFIQGNSADSAFTFKSKRYYRPTISMQTPYNYTGGSLAGDISGHYQQTLYYCYQIELPVDTITFILNNSATSNYEVTITFSGIELVLHSGPVGQGNSIQIDYDCTTEIVAYITIVGVDGHGSFRLFVDGTMNHKAGLNTLQLISLFALGLIVIQGTKFLKLKKKR
ncbi:MAG: clostripain-related cysteine peptidase [Candidatus Heimdallarchaeota archaeon]